MQRVYAFQFMLLGATAIIGAYAEPVSSLPRLFLALVIWLVGWRSTHLLVSVVAPEQREQQTTPPLNPPLCPHRQQQQQKEKRNVEERN
uniref:Secreted protein n=1 Tax=Oryza glumipatula TaxID=40148 RepID=A0A0D9YZ13_9ORYZ